MSPAISPGVPKYCVRFRLWLIWYDQYSEKCCWDVVAPHYAHETVQKLPEHMSSGHAKEMLECDVEHCPTTLAWAMQCKPSQFPACSFAWAMCPADTKTHPFSAKLNNWAWLKMDVLNMMSLHSNALCQSPWLHIAQTHLGQAFATLRFSMAFVWGHCISCQFTGTMGTPTFSSHKLKKCLHGNTRSRRTLLLTISV